MIEDMNDITDEATKANYLERVREATIMIEKLNVMWLDAFSKIDESSEDYEVMRALGHYLKES